MLSEALIKPNMHNHLHGILHNTLTHNNTVTVWRCFPPSMHTWSSETLQYLAQLYLLWSTLAAPFFVYPIWSLNFLFHLVNGVLCLVACVVLWMFRLWLCQCVAQRFTLQSTLEGSNRKKWIRPNKSVHPLRYCTLEDAVTHRTLDT